VLRRPFESAQYASEQFQRLMADNGIVCSDTEQAYRAALSSGVPPDHVQLSQEQQV
jgi:hypothetical protein